MIKNYNRALHHELFLELLRFSLFNKTPDYGHYKNLDETVWKNIMTTAQEQALLGVCYPALEHLPFDCRPPQNIYLAWAAKANYIRQDNKNKLKVLSEVLFLFESNSVKPIVMKGISSAMLYPEPGLRYYGDIDLFIPHNYNVALEIIEKSGYKISSTERHHKFYYKGVLIELHKHIIASPFDQLNKYSTIDVECYGCKFKIFDRTTTTILLFTHAVTHLIGPGIGFRQICDLILLNNEFSDIDFLFIERYIKKNKLSRFTNLISCLIYQLSLDDKNKSVITIFNKSHVSQKDVLSLERDIFIQGDCGNNNLMYRRKFHKIVRSFFIFKRYIKFTRYSFNIPIKLLVHKLLSYLRGFARTY